MYILIIKYDLIDDFEVCKGVWMISLLVVGVIKGDNVYLEKKRNFVILCWGVFYILFFKFVKDVFDSCLIIGVILIWLVWLDFMIFLFYFWWSF